MKTQKEIQYHTSGQGIILIPAGTTVVPASNLPDEGKRYWSKGWRGMLSHARSWKRNYGFLLTLAEVKGE